MTQPRHPSVPTQPHQSQRPSSRNFANRPSTVLVGLAFVTALLVPMAVLAQEAVEIAEPAPGRIVYTRQHEANFDMWLSDPDGSDEQRLVEFERSAAGEDHPRWSPDGTRIVFAATDDAQQISLYVVGFEGGEPERFAERIGIRGGEPEWSPDGECIAYSAHHEGGLPSATDLRVRCIDGEPARILTDTSDTDERMPHWSPDGQTIYFTSRPSGDAGDDVQWSLHAIDADGDNRRVILETEEYTVRFPRVSPDGSRLAFIASRSNNEGFYFGTLHVADVDGSNVHPLITKPAGPFAWSPDSAELLFNNIANEGVTLVEALGASLAPDDPTVRSATRILQETQAKGLYRIDVDSKQVSRLAGKAGGVIATPDAFDFGYAPDWTAGTYTPTPTATSSPTATSTPTVTPTPTVGEPTATGDRGVNDPHIFLPLLMRNHEAPATATPTITATVVATTTAPVSPTVTAAPFR